MTTKKIVLRDDEMPTQWYNVAPDIPNGLLPPLDPETKEPMGPEKLGVIFPMSLLEQEMSGERFIDIPEEVLDVLKIWRPSPLVRARNLEKALDTKAKIYFKNEGVSPVGSHKPNSAVPQAYYNAKEGITRLATETGAGQWGSALSFASQKFGLDCKVYMVRVSFDQKPYRKSMMHTFGASIVASPVKRQTLGARFVNSIRILPDHWVLRSRKPLKMLQVVMTQTMHLAQSSTMLFCIRPSSALRQKNRWKLPVTILMLLLAAVVADLTLQVLLLLLCLTILTAKKSVSWVLNLLPVHRSPWVSLLMILVMLPRQLRF